MKENKTMTASQVWKDLIDYLVDTDTWETLKKKERDYIRKTGAQIALNPVGKKGGVGYARIQKWLDHYAPGRYEFGRYWSLK